MLAASAKLSQPTGQRQSNVRTQQKKKYLIRPILFLYYEESLVSSNLNSKLLRFHCAHPIEDTKRTFRKLTTSLVTLLVHENYKMLLQK